MQSSPNSSWVVLGSVPLWTPLARLVVGSFLFFKRWQSNLLKNNRKHELIKNYLYRFDTKPSTGTNQKSKAKGHTWTMNTFNLIKHWTLSKLEPTHTTDWNWPLQNIKYPITTSYNLCLSHSLGVQFSQYCSWHSTPSQIQITACFSSILFLFAHLVINVCLQKKKKLLATWGWKVWATGSMTDQNVFKSLSWVKGDSCFWHSPLFEGFCYDAVRWEIMSNTLIKPSFLNRFFCCMKLSLVCEKQQKHI